MQLQPLTRVASTFSSFITSNMYVLTFDNRASSRLAIFGEKTFPIATSEAGDVVIAGAEYGKVIDCYGKTDKNPENLLYISGSQHFCSHKTNKI